MTPLLVVTQQRQSLTHLLQGAQISEVLSKKFIRFFFFSTQKPTFMNKCRGGLDGATLQPLNPKQCELVEGEDDGTPLLTKGWSGVNRIHGKKDTHFKTKHCFFVLVVGENVLNSGRLHVFYSCSQEDNQGFIELWIVTRFKLPKHKRRKRN